MEQQYTQAGLERLYQAIKQQAEQEFIDAIHRDFPDMTTTEETDYINIYRALRANAEQQIIAQSRGNK
jgi:hypothetical protein